MTGSFQNWIEDINAQIEKSQNFQDIITKKSMTSVSQTNYSILQDNQSTHWNEYYSQYTNLDLFLGLARTLLSNVIKLIPVVLISCL